jgi:hypothetical protein
MNDFDENYSYESQCTFAIYDCLVLVITPCINLAKKEIINNFINLDMSNYISNFKPYKSRLQLNIPLLRKKLYHHMTSILTQFFDEEYTSYRNTNGTLEDLQELILKTSDILSNKLLGKNIISNKIKIENKKINKINLY